MSDVQKFGEEFHRVGKNGVDAAVHSFGEMNKGLQAIAAEVTDYSKKAFEDGHPCLRAVARRKVVRAGDRDSVSVRENGL